MTTIITTTGNNFATLTADQGITSDLIHPDMPKIIVQDTWLIGVAGNARVCDQLQYMVRYPKPPPELLGQHYNDWFAWVVTKVIPAIDSTLKSTDMEANALLVTHGKAFLIDESLSVLSAQPYWAIGSGAFLAIGALANKQYEPDWNKNHDLSALSGMQAASMHDLSTRGPVDQYKSLASGKIIERTNGI